MLPGIPAALFMAVTKTLLKARSLSDRPMERMIAWADHTFRLQSILAGAGEIADEKITGAAAKNVRSFRGEREQSDDMPVMAIRRRALKESIF